jgi:hypothetical protein
MCVFLVPHTQYWKSNQTISDRLLTIIRDNEGTYKYVGFPLNLFAGPPDDGTPFIRESLALSIQRTLTAGTMDEVEMTEIGGWTYNDHDISLGQLEEGSFITVEEALDYLAYGN